MGGKLFEKAVYATTDPAQVKTGAGTLHKVVVNNHGSSWVVRFGDSTSGTPSDLATIAFFGNRTYEFNIRLNAGLRLTTVTGTAGNITIIYE